MARNIKITKTTKNREKFTQISPTWKHCLGQASHACLKTAKYAFGKQTRQKQTEQAKPTQSKT